jgi:hypothetical protein
VLGQGYRRSTYGYDGLVLARRPFTFLSASSPVWTRVLVELAQSQTFRRRLSSLDPMFQVLGADLRLDLPPDPQLFGREIGREFPTVRRVIDDLYAELTRVNAAGDGAFERDAVWPPGGFWERRETSRALSMLPYLDTGDFLAELPREHVFRDVVATPAAFASDLAEGAPAFAVARLHGAWTRGVNHLQGGEEELVDFLLERVRAHGGETRMSERASSLSHKGGKVRGVHLDAHESAIGVTFVVADASTNALCELAPAFDPPTTDERPVVEIADQRFVVSIVVRPEGLPVPLATESFLVPKRGPRIHLQRSPLAAPGTALLVAETLLDGAVTNARERVLAAVLEFLPFLERHLLLVDSPHDGRPLWDLRRPNAVDPNVGPKELGLRAELVDRARLRGAGGSLEAEPMIPRYRVAQGGLYGLAGEPLRTPLVNAFVTGRTVLPSLGQEGELLAAWGVARIITRTDKRKEKMLREMWSKVELS